MLHCPYCGTNVQDNESFCVGCGKKLPDNLKERLHTRKGFNRYWLLPITLAVVVLCASGIYFLFLQNQTAQAKEDFSAGKDAVDAGNYTEALSSFEDAINHKNNFPHAEAALDFVQTVQEIDANVEKGMELLDANQFQVALDLIEDSEKALNPFNGDVVKDVIDRLTEKRDTIYITRIQHELDQEPEIDDLKILLWDAEEIKSSAADQITSEIQSQIVEYIFSKASEQLNDNHFSDALLLVEDGLKYASESEKLQSLKTTIEKEQVSFETAQQDRIEQAMDTAAKEQEINENDAIELVSVSVEENDQGKWVVIGEVKSVATIPVNSISVDYALETKKGSELLTNQVFVYPDTLYPDETGKFEFTHYDIDQKDESIDVDVNKIKWYTS